MNTKRLLLATALGPVIGLAAPPRDQTPRFAPESGSSAIKTFRMEGSFDLDELSVVLDGQDLGGMLGELVLSAESNSTIVVSDGYLELEDGRPARLERTFETLEASFSLSLATAMGDEHQGMGSASPLEGATVVFVFDPDEGEYLVEYLSGEGDEDLLEGLEEDMDLRFLLPEGEVSVGDTWEVDVSEFIALVMVGGDLGFAPEDLESGDFENFGFVEEVLEETLHDTLAEVFEGTCTCTFAGVGEDESHLAEIEIELEVSSAVDLVELLTEIVEAIAGAQGEETLFELEVADLDVDLESEGTLLWNLEAGRFESLELGAEGDIGVDLQVSWETEQGDHSGEASLELTVSLEISAAAE